MKYINHMTCAHLDSKMQELIDQHGMVGYGAYWVIAERIAAQIRPESVSTQWTLSWAALARHLGYTRTTLVQHLCSTMHTAGLIVLTKRSDKLITIDMPNLLKYADEYSKKVLKKKSGQTPDKLSIDSGSPALPALPALQKEKKDLRQPVDNSVAPPITDGAKAAGGGLLEAPPPPAPRPTIPADQDPEILKAQEDLIQRRKELGIPETGRASPIQAMK